MQYTIGYFSVSMKEEQGEGRRAKGEVKKP
jgi:hypothetical protein